MKTMIQINAKLRKCNSKMICILNHNGLRNSEYARQLHAENRRLRMCTCAGDTQADSQRACRKGNL